MIPDFFLAGVLGFPLAGFLASGLFLRGKPQLAAAASVSAVVGAFFSACALFLALSLDETFGASGGRTFTFFSWISAGGLNIPFAFHADPLSLLMSLLVTGVGAAVHIYSLGYMAGDKGLARYFAFLNLFVFQMSVLVFADSLPLLFVGWEGVGLCSYFLIGFHRRKAFAARAGMKAFLVNRAGDAFFLLGIFLIFSQFRTLNFQDINSAALAASQEGPFMSRGALAALFLFLGAMAKSAQAPLHIWLADAMAGPTPVSALIHAATMVTAGIYLVLRLSGLFGASPEILSLMGGIGALTALGAALAACAQRDLKKILAYSTVSQLAYMFMALSVKAWTAAFFHLLTHGFFKALLFLCAGSIIHGLNGEKDIYKMGGLRKHFPWTFPAWLVGALALATVPPLSGFFSKDEILWSVFIAGKPGLWFAGLAGGALTAFYIARATALVFFGKERRARGAPLPHESRPIMTLPLGVLAFFAVTAGVLGVPHIVSAFLPGHPPHVLHQYLGFLDKFSGPAALEASLMILSALLSVTVLAGAFYYFSFYYFSRAGKALAKDRRAAPAGALPRAALVLEKAFYADEAVQALTIDPFKKAAKGLNQHIEKILIQGGIRVFVRRIRAFSEQLSRLQSGDLSVYAFYCLAGMTILLTLAFL